ncbi:DUF6350 family protein [Luteimicrobium subarcticum]|uniref:cell division protein PerM n=1 Tax=Luteimicrobium subarcticum TaxID=620910 RepID=UPI0012FE6529|nr:DUF6350 family protein [Luteimicrobium subarcticum]
MSSTTPTRSPRARTIDAEPDAPRRGLRGLRRRTGRTDDGSGRGARTQQVVAAVGVVVQTVVLPLVVVAVVVGAVLVASPPSSGSGWGRTAQVTGAVWLAAQGVPLVTGGVTLTIVPLGVTALSLLVGYRAARRTLRPSALPLLLAVVLYTGVVAGASLLTTAVAPGAVWRGAVGAALLAATAFTLGSSASGRGPTVGERALAAQDAVLRRVRWIGAPWFDGLRRGFVAGLVAVLLLVAVAGLLVVVWAVSGRSTVADVLRLLDPGVVGGGVLAVAQLALVPNLVAWAAAWVVGPGFGIGTDSLYATTAHVEGALPALPVVGVLPGAGWTNDVSVLAPLVVVVLGVVAGGFLWRSHAYAGGTSWSGLVVSVVVAAATAGLLVVGLEGLANGAAGPGVLVQVGADAWRTGAWAAAEVGVGVVLAVGWRLLGIGPWLRRTLGRQPA